MTNPSPGHRPTPHPGRGRPASGYNDLIAFVAMMLATNSPDPLAFLDTLINNIHALEREATARLN